MKPETATNHQAGADVPNVLIVEDEQISRKALATLLESYGYKPSAYRSAEEVLEHLSEHESPLVMLVDVDLPGMTGLELIEKLRRSQRAFRAVLITAADSDRVARFRRDNPVDYMRKPVNLQRLLELLAHFYTQQQRPH